MSPTTRTITLTILVLLFTTTPRLQADVLYLYDGNVLIVDKAWVEGDQVKYQTSRGVQTLSREDVREIRQEKPIPVPAKRWSLGVVSGSDPENSVPASSTETTQFRESLSRLRENLRADPASARARGELIYALASVSSLQATQGDLPGAVASVEEAQSLDKRNLVILGNLAVLRLRMGGYREAEALLRTGLELESNNQDLHYLLGEAYYAQEKIAEAINQWSAGLLLGPHPEMLRSLDKARQEARVHDALGALQSAHFILRYDRNVSDPLLGQQMLVTLEQLYTRLSTQLVSRPPATIAVILYPDQTYFNITRATSWSGALFDGKIRIPTKGLTTVTPELTSILVHELTHAFIDSLSGNCPTWFNEGVAQLEEGKTATNDKAALARLRENDQLMGFKDLGGSFLGFSAARAEVAYVESLSAVEYMVAKFGKASIRSVLDLMAQNYNFENAFKTALRQTVPEFEVAWQRDLLR